MMSPWLKLCKFLGGEVGKKMGRVVQGDVKAWEKIPGWTHKAKIEELATDSGLSPSYLKELIQESSKKEDLLEIKVYLDSTRSGLLPKSVYTNLSKKLQEVEDSEVLKELIRAAKEKGISHLDTVADFLDVLA